MLIELRASDDRLRGPKALDAAPILSSAYKAVTDSPADLSRTRVVCETVNQTVSVPETYCVMVPYTQTVKVPVTTCASEECCDGHHGRLLHRHRGGY